MKEQPVTPVQDAARRLRSGLGLSQQAMATALGLSMGALRNYESGFSKAPDARALYAYTLIAEADGFPDLATVFRAAFYEATNLRDCADGRLAYEPGNAFEQIMVASLLAVLRGRKGFQKYQRPVLDAFAGAPLFLIRSVNIDKDERDAFVANLAQRKREA